MLRELHKELGIPADYGGDGSKPAYLEAPSLIDVGPNLMGKPQRLTPSAAVKWQAMVSAARDDGVTLLLVSGYRSIDYQAGLIALKNSRRVNRLAKSWPSMRRPVSASITAAAPWMSPRQDRDH